MRIPILSNFSKNGPPGQTTILMRSIAKFYVEPRSTFSNIFHQDPETSGKPLIVSWPNVDLSFQVTAATAVTSQQLWHLAGALVHRAQRPNIPFGESLTSTIRVSFVEVHTFAVLR